jgi:hypothetical protein
MPLRRSALAAALALAGCNAWQDRAEFAPPQSRWPASLSSPVMADAPPPPIPMQYCYRTLARVDCFSEAMPERITGYTGLYPEPQSLPPAPATVPR